MQKNLRIRKTQRQSRKVNSSGMQNCCAISPNIWYQEAGGAEAAATAAAQGNRDGEIASRSRRGRVGKFPLALLRRELRHGVGACFFCCSPFPSPSKSVFGPLRASHPLFILAVYSPAIAAFALVAWHGGIRGLRGFLFTIAEVACRRRAGMPCCSRGCLRFSSWVLPFPAGRQARRWSNFSPRFASRGGCLHAVPRTNRRIRLAWIRDAPCCSGGWLRCLRGC